MTHFFVGEQVIIRWGIRQGQKGKIMKSLEAEVYKVKIEDGPIGYFVGKGLVKQEVRIQEPV